MSPQADPSTLIAAAAKLDPVAVAMRVLDNPTRAAVGASAAGTLALAGGVLGYWQIAQEARLLCRAMRLITGRSEAHDARRAEWIEHQLATVEQLLDAIPSHPSQPTEGETQ